MTHREPKDPNAVTGTRLPSEPIGRDPETGEPQDFTSVENQKEGREEKLGAVAAVLAGSGGTLWPVAVVMVAYAMWQSYSAARKANTTGALTDEEIRGVTDPFGPFNSFTDFSKKALPKELPKELNFFGTMNVGANALFGSTKPDAQILRDRWRKQQEELGTFEVIDGSHNLTLADGSKFDVGIDGANKLDNVDGSQRLYAETDLSDPTTQQTIGFLNPLGMIQAPGNKDLATGVVGYYVNATQSNAGGDIEIIRRNTLTLYEQQFGEQAKELGISTEETVLGYIELLESQGLITKEEAASSANGIRQLYGSAPLTPPGTSPEEDPADPTGGVTGPAAEDGRFVTDSSQISELTGTSDLPLDPSGNPKTQDQLRPAEEQPPAEVPPLGEAPPPIEQAVVPLGGDLAKGPATLDADSEIAQQIAAKVDPSREPDPSAPLPSRTTGDIVANKPTPTDGELAKDMTGQDPGVEEPLKADDFIDPETGFFIGSEALSKSKLKAENDAARKALEADEAKAKKEAIARQLAFGELNNMKKQEQAGINQRLEDERAQRDAERLAAPITDAILQGSL